MNNSKDNGDPLATENLEPLPGDRRIAESALQKAICRGLAHTAQRAAASLLPRHARAFWRGVVRIACENVGVADPGAVVEVVDLAASPRERARFGGDLAAAAYACARLAEAAKDHSGFFAAACAIADPDLEAFRKTCASSSLDELVAFASQPTRPLTERAVAALAVSGLPSFPKRRATNGGIKALLDALGAAGVPYSLLDAARLAAQSSGVPASVLLPLLWLETRGAPARIEAGEADTPEVEGVPLAALDGQTEIGDVALLRFALENGAIGDHIAEGIPAASAPYALRLASLFADGLTVDRRFVWPGAATLETDGADAAFIGCDVDPDAGDELVALFLKHLDHLNAIRAELFRTALAREG